MLLPKGRAREGRQDSLAGRGDFRKLPNIIYCMTLRSLNNGIFHHAKKERQCNNWMSHAMSQGSPN